MISRDRNKKGHEESGKTSDPRRLSHDSQQDQKREDRSCRDDRREGQSVAEEGVRLIPNYDNCHPNTWNRINMDNQWPAGPNDLSPSQ